MLGPKTRVELLLQYEQELMNLAKANHMTAEEFIDLSMLSEQRNVDLDRGFQIIERIKELQTEH